MAGGLYYERWDELDLLFESSEGISGETSTITPKSVVKKPSHILQRLLHDIGMLLSTTSKTILVLHEEKAIQGGQTMMSRSPTACGDEDAIGKAGRDYNKSLQD